MIMRQPGAKVPWENCTPQSEEALIPLFHQWIRDGLMNNHLMIDVADYRHVPDGPGVMLISHEAHLSMDRTLGSVGLYYQSKKDKDGESSQQISFALKELAKTIEIFRRGEKSGDFKFSTREFSLHSTCRLHIKNTKEDFKKIEKEISSTLQKVVGHSDLKIEQKFDPRAPFSIGVELGQDIHWDKIATL